MNYSKASAVLLVAIGFFQRAVYLGTPLEGNLFNYNGGLRKEVGLLFDTE